MRYLVDTDWIIDAIAERPQAIELLRRLRREGIAVSVISLGEIYDGAFDDVVPERKLAQYRQFLTGFPVIPLSDAVMVMFGRERSRLRKAGTQIPDLDLLIGVSAVQNDLRLLTRNVRHYGRIQGINIHPSE